MGARKPLNLSMDAELVDRAKALDINLSQALEAKLRDIVREEEAARWQREHKGAIDAWNRWIAPRSSSIFPRPISGLWISRTKPETDLSLAAFSMRLMVSRRSSRASPKGPTWPALSGIELLSVSIARRTFSCFDDSDFSLLADDSCLGLPLSPAKALKPCCLFRH